MQIEAGRRLGDGTRPDLLCGLVDKGRFSDAVGGRFLRTAEQFIVDSSGDMAALMQAPQRAWMEVVSWSEAVCSRAFMSRRP